MKKILPIFAANMTAYQEAASSVGFNKTMLAKLLECEGSARRSSAPQEAPARQFRM